MLTRAEAFDYSTVPADKAASARAAAERIRGRMQLAAESIIEVGRELIQQKKDLGHGNFLAWIEAEFGMSRQTADNFVHVASRFGDNLPSISNLGATALYALAAPSTPEPIREQVLERAASGEKVTAKEIERLKKDLEKAKAEAAEKEEMASLRLGRAQEAEAQRDAAQTELVYAKSDKERLAAELADAREEISRLHEDGVIHVLPSAPAALSQDNSVIAVVERAETQFRNDVDAALMNLRRVWNSADNDWRADYLAAKGVAAIGDLI